MVVGSREPEDLRADAVLRVDALLLGVEAEPCDVLALELGRLDRIGLARDVDEARCDS